TVQALAGRFNTTSKLADFWTPILAYFSAPIDKDEDGVSTGCDALADFGQVQAHQLGVDGRQYKRCSDGPRRADGAEDIGPVMALIAWCRRPGASPCPDPR